MTDRTHESIAELLGAYALDAVSSSERALVEAHLPACPKCADEVRQHREVAAYLGNSGADAPGGVWTQISDSLHSADDSAPVIDFPIAPGRTVALGDHAPTPGGGRRAGPDRPDSDTVIPLFRHRSARIAAAAAVIVVAVGFGAGLARLADDTGPVDSVAAIHDLADIAFAEPDARRVVLRSDDGNVAAAAVLTDEGIGFLRGDELPPLGDDRTYQLWGVRGTVIFSLGVLGNDPDVVSFAVGDGVDVLVLTDEVEGGVPTSEQPPLLTGVVS